MTTLSEGRWAGTGRQRRGDTRRIAERRDRGRRGIVRRKRAGQHGRSRDDRRHRDAAPRTMLDMRRVVIAGSIDRKLQLTAERFGKGKSVYVREAFFVRRIMKTKQ